MPNNPSIRLFATGGTFDKEYDLIHGKLFFKDTHLQEMLKQGRSGLNIQLRTLMMIDSLDMTDADREIIIHNCKQCSEDKIVITHGTDTMVKTAQHLAQANIAKTIVITGALIPYKFGSSDGFFNLGNALAFVQTLPNGVYIVMNGKYFHWNKVKKNYTTGIFEDVENNF